MTLLYVLCAAVGGTVLVCQFVLTLVGFGGDAEAHDVGHDAGHDMAHETAHDAPHGQAAHGHDATWYFKVLTLRTLVAAFAFFGLAGLAAQTAGWPAGYAFAAAIAAGGAAMYVVHAVMRLLADFRADGTIRLERSLGASGTVYLRIPAARSGRGKVHLSLQGRLVEVEALTEGDELKTGASIVVTGLIDRETVAVSAA